jgi:membrane-associated HD superfamily phosphohydrolase
MESDQALSRTIKLLYGIMFIFTGAVVFGFSYFAGKSQEAILRNTIVSLLITGTVIFMLMDAAGRGKEGFYYDNYCKRNRFFVVYMIMIPISCAFSLVPNVFWPYLALFVILALFSNPEIGLISGLGFVTFSVMLEPAGEYGELFMYVLAGAVAVALFRDLKENSSIGLPMAISLLMQGVLLIAYNVLFQNRTLSLKILALPVLNLMLDLIILLIFLNMFGVYVIRKSNDMYMEINDTEYPLLVELKNKDKDEYFRAIHTGYLAERIALGLGFNDRAVKTCSYYHRIGLLDGSLKWADVEHYYMDNDFPEEAIEFLHEYLEPEKGKARSREALAVQLSETVVASIMYLLRQNPDVKIDYDKLIDGLFDKKAAEGELSRFSVTFYEYERMRKILKKEKLYYDFLR